MSSSKQGDPSTTLFQDQIQMRTWAGTNLGIL